MSNQAAKPGTTGERHLAVLEGVLERITYANDETGYTVARVDTGRGGGDLLTVVGALLGAQAGESLRMEGRWGSHPQYGKQFTVENYTTLLPATIQGIRRYLGSGLVKGIGPVFADRITQHFGLDTLQIIEDEPKRLIEVPGLGPKRTKKIAEAWEEQKAIKEVMLFLQTVEVSTSIAVRIYKKYGDASISVVKNQPYRLASDVWGIGFLTADKIAQSVGIPHDSPERVKAGLQYALSQATDQGNCYLPEERLIADAVKLLQVDTGLVIECLAELALPDEESGDPGVVREKVPGPDGSPDPVTAVYLVPFHRAELSLAAQLRAPPHRRGPHARLPRRGLGQGMGMARTAYWRGARARAGGRRQARPHQEGRRAHRRSRLRQILHRAVHRRAGPRQEGQGRPGRPHRPRGETPRRTDRRRSLNCPPPAGTQARRRRGVRQGPAPGRRLGRGRRGVHARPPPRQQAGEGRAPGAHILFVGDVDQLPSVGAGEVLRDLLADGGPIPAVRLTRVFRQAQQSGVVTNAHRINAYQHPVTDGMKDFFLFVEDDTEEASAGSPWTWRRGGFRPSSGSTRAGTCRCSRPCTGARRARAT